MGTPSFPLWGLEPQRLWTREPYQARETAAVSGTGPGARRFRLETVRGVTARSSSAKVTSVRMARTATTPPAAMRRAEYEGKCGEDKGKTDRRQNAE